MTSATAQHCVPSRTPLDEFPPWGEKKRSTALNTSHDQQSFQQLNKLARATLRVHGNHTHHALHYLISWFAQLYLCNGVRLGGFKRINTAYREDLE